MLRPKTRYAAGDVWGRNLVANYAGETIGVSARFGPSIFANTIAFGGPLAVRFGFTGSVPNARYPAALANQLFGRDLFPPGSPSTPTGNEIGITFGNAVNWSYHTTGTPGAGQIDFLTVALHEIGHGLGFTTNIASDGSYGRGTPTFPDIYDRFVVDEFGTRLTGLTNAARLAAVTDFGGLFWAGDNAAAANGGARPALAARDGAYVEGTSVLHFSTSAFDALGRRDILMVTSVGVDRVIRTPDAITLGVLQDMGWDIQPTLVAVPEPGTLAVLAVGLAGLGAHIWRRQSVTASR